MEDIYPLTLYREGGQFDWDGRPTDACMVQDAEEHSEALAQGWFEAVSYLAGPVESDAWDALTEDELRAAATDAGLNLHHKTGRAKLLEALRAHKGQEAE